MTSRFPPFDQAAIRLLGERDGALCTLVGLEGSFSREPGAQLAIAWDGEPAGSLSDGCLEHELATQAALARQKGRPVVLRYGRGSSKIDFRLPCGAGVDILVDPVPDRRAIGRVCSTLDERQPAVLAIPRVGAFGAFQRRYLPGLRLLLFGAGPELEQLEALSRSYGALVTVRTPGNGVALHQAPSGVIADAWTAVLLLFHDHEWEEEILPWALATPAFYVGSIGGSLTQINRLDRLSLRGVDSRARARVRGPVGLIPSTRDPGTLALSILAEVVQDYERLRRSEPLLRPSAEILAPDRRSFAGV